jgi:hypothetical protein
MNSSSKIAFMSPVEFWKSLFDWGSIVLVTLTVFTGAGALITGKIISERQDKKIAELNARAASAEKTAKAFELEIADARKDADSARKDAEKFKLDIAAPTNGHPALIKPQPKQNWLSKR